MTKETVIKAFEAFEEVNQPYIFSDIGATNVALILEAALASRGLAIVDLNSKDENQPNHSIRYRPGDGIVQASLSEAS